MGELELPEEDTVEQTSEDAPPVDAATTEVVEAGQQSVCVAVEHPAATPSRPLANVLVVLIVLAMLLVANERSSASRPQSLRTIDDNEYVEPVPSSTIDMNRAPAVVRSVDTAITATSVPETSIATAITEEPLSAHTATTIVADTTPATGTMPAPPVETAAGGGDGGGGGGGSGVSRSIPDPGASPAAAVVSPWADKTRMTGAGYVATDVGCAGGTSAGALDAFFKERVGPVIGDDYQHVYPLGGDRYLWLFQDAFVDYSGAAANLSQGVFAHNVAMVQDGACFTLYHRGSISKPGSFEQGNGENWKSKWFWPMGGETVGGRVYVYWAQMLKDGYDPTGANGLGWHPVQTWLAVYDAGSLQRLSFQPAANAGVSPIYGYSVASDSEYTYLFGNTFEQNLQREGGYHNGPHSGTKMWLARVPLGQFGAAPEYRSGDTWTPDPGQATPISERYWAENPMQPRYMNGQWVATTKVDGYWGESLAIDVANDPWGPWTTVAQRGLSPRGGDPLMNTYHAYLMPWLSGGSLVVSVSQNARNMLRDAWPRPTRYRPMFFGAALVAPPPRPIVDETSTTTTIIEETTTTSVVDTTTTDASTSTTVTPTTVAETTTTTVPETTTTTTTIPETTTTTTTIPPPPPPPPPPPSSTTTVPAPTCSIDPDTSSTSSTTTTVDGAPPPPPC